MIKDMNVFIKNANKTIQRMVSNLEKLPTLELDTLKPTKTLLVIIDMNKGFAIKGNLSSPLVKAMIAKIEKLTKECMNRDILTIAYSDRHQADSPELETYLKHCMEGTDETELVDELKRLNILTYNKNSTNGFISNGNMFEVLKETHLEDPINDIDNFIVTGCVTDICVYQFATTLKAYLNEVNKKARVIVPMDCVETFDVPDVHDAELMNVIFLNSMLDNGIEVIKSIK